MTKWKLFFETRGPGSSPTCGAMRNRHALVARGAGDRLLPVSYDSGTRSKRRGQQTGQQGDEAETWYVGRGKDILAIFGCPLLW